MRRPRTLVEMMARQFDKAVTPALRQRLQNRGLTLHQGITLASIVEREAAIPGRAADHRQRLPEPDQAEHAAPGRPDRPVRSGERQPRGGGRLRLLEARPDPRRSPATRRRTTPTCSAACRPARSVVRGCRRWRPSPIPPRRSTCSSWRRATAATSSRRRTRSTRRTWSGTSGDRGADLRPPQPPPPCAGEGEQVDYLAATPWQREEHDTSGSPLPRTGEGLGRGLLRLRAPSRPRIAAYYQQREAAGMAARYSLFQRGSLFRMQQLRARRAGGARAARPRRS